MGKYYQRKYSAFLLYIFPRRVSPGGWEWFLIISKPDYTNQVGPDFPVLSQNHYISLNEYFHPLNAYLTQLMVDLCFVIFGE